MVFILFEPAQQSYSGLIDDTQLLRSFKQAGDAVSLFIALGEEFYEVDRAAILQF